MLACFDHESAVGGQAAFIAAERLGHQGGRGVVRMNRTRRLHTGA
jgi:hypothetical protein